MPNTNDYRGRDGRRMKVEDITARFKVLRKDVGEKSQVADILYGRLESGSLSHLKKGCANIKVCFNSIRTRYSNVSERLDDILSIITSKNFTRKDRLQYTKRYYLTIKAENDNLFYQSQIAQDRILGEIESLRNEISGKNALAITKKSISEELRGLYGEFNTVLWNTSGIAVRTKDITLWSGSGKYGVELGAFYIILWFDNIDEGNVTSKVVSVVPVKPHWADIYCHPHVQGNYLCAGNADVIGTTRLYQGLLFEFFMVVNGVLSGYNQQSPYYSLSKWKRRINGPPPKEK